MRVVFAGTPAFAATALRRLNADGYDIPLVLTQPDRPGGRGLRLNESPVKQAAGELGLALAQPRSLRLDGRFPADAQAAQRLLCDARAHVMVVAAYGLILPQWVLDLMRQRTDDGPALGCLNIHASLLPRWRGAAPIHRAIEAGDTETGITIMQMDAGLDTGDMLLTESIPVRHGGPDADTAGSLHDRLATLGADLTVRALRDAEQGSLVARPQHSEGASYARKIEKAEAELDWTQDAAVLERRMRAFDPAPGAWSTLEGDVVKLWRAEWVDAASEVPAAAPGTVLDVGAQGIAVACGTGTLRLLALQRAGGRRMEAAAFLRGMLVRPGMQFGSRAAPG